MHLRNIHISAFQCFPGQVEINDIGEGATLIVGDNEEGKSTVLAAIQTALFEKHNVTGAVANAMLPYGSKVRPEITLDFDHDGTRYRLHKAFVQKPVAELKTDSGRSWTGDAAEEQLREMLEFTPPGKGGAKLEHRGLQALFWVEQGSAYSQPHVNETTHDRLAGALESEVGTVTGGERGRTLIKLIESRRNKLLTEKTGKPAGEYREAVRHAEELRTSRDAIIVRLKDFDNEVDELTRERERLAKLETDNPIDKANKRVEKATDAVAKIDSLESRLKTAEANLNAATSGQQLAKSQHDERQKRRKEVAAADNEVLALKEKETLAQEIADTAQKTLDAAKEKHDKVKTALESAQKVVVVAQRLADLLLKTEELDTAESHRENAETAYQSATNLAANAKASPFTLETIEELRRLDGESREAKARLEAVATFVELTPSNAQRASIDGKDVETQTITLTDRTTIEFEGYGAISVTPGGEDIFSRREAADTAFIGLKKYLDELGAVDLSNAVRKSEERDTLIKEEQIHRTTIEAHAPRGLDTLRNQVAELQAEVRRIKQEINDTSVLEITADEAAKRAAGLVQGLKDAESYERLAWDELKNAEGNFQAAAMVLSAANQRWKENTTTASATRKDLDAAAIERSDKDLKKAFDDVTNNMQDASKIFEEFKETLVECDPDGARREIGAANSAHDMVEKNLNEFHRKVRDLEVELRTLGQTDMVADLEVAEGELERVEASEARLRHEAEALTLLCYTLADEEQTARETFLGPIRERVEPYLRRLFPKSEIVLDDQTLEIKHLRRNGLNEAFNRLSVGTREQLAVLTRLAFADLLRAHGKQSPLILDDALVYSDDQRLVEMQRILDRAADQLQIIVLTCHERTYFDLGWSTIRLEECRISPDP